MDTTLITEEMLQKIILGAVNADGEKYWIKSINRASRSTLKGTVVEVAPNEENGGGIPHLYLTNLVLSLKAI